MAVSEVLQTSDSYAGPSTSSSGGPKKSRRRTTPQDLRVLEQSFEENALPDRDTRQSLANEIGWDQRAVQVWFQNRRQRAKRERETEAFYARNGASPVDKENAPIASTASALPRPPSASRSKGSAAGPARTAPLPLRTPSGPYMQPAGAGAARPSRLLTTPRPPLSRNSSAGSDGNEVWRLMPSSPERSDLSSSPVKADMRSMGLRRTMSLDVLASRPQAVFGQPSLFRQDAGPNTPRLMYSLPSESDTSDTSEEAVTPDASVHDGGPNKWELDDQDRECANLLLQLFAAAA